MWRTSTRKFEEPPIQYSTKPYLAPCLSPPPYSQPDNSTESSHLHERYAQLPPYKQYFSDKFQWNLPFTDHIEWQMIDYAMRRFNLQDWIWIQRLSTNGLLPGFHLEIIPAKRKTDYVPHETSTKKPWNTCYIAPAHHKAIYIRNSKHKCQCFTLSTTLTLIFFKCGG